MLVASGAPFDQSPPKPWNAPKPRVWAETRLRLVSSASNYDLAPDSKRLAAIVADDPNGENCGGRRR